MDSSIGTVIIPAMGLSQRFKDQGYQTHKALLKVNGSPIIKQIVDTIPDMWDVRLVIPESLSLDFRAVLGERATYVTLAGPTEGQSQTILRGILGLNAAKPVAVTNCDVLFKGQVVADFLDMPGTRIAVHQDLGSEPKFSYVSIDLDGFIDDVREKEKISLLAQTGFWKFAVAGRLHKALAMQIAQDLRHTNGEFYLSAAINLYNYAKRPYLVDVNDWVDLGTPEAILQRGLTIG